MSLMIGPITDRHIQNAVDYIRLFSENDADGAYALTDGMSEQDLVIMTCVLAMFTIKHHRLAGTNTMASVEFIAADFNEFLESK